MKTIALFLLLCGSVAAQTWDDYRPMAPLPKAPKEKPVEKPIGEWREINGTPSWTLSEGWWRGYAKVTASRPDGAIHADATLHPRSKDANESYRGPIYLLNYGTRVADGAIIEIIAKDAGLYSYESLFGYRTLHKLDCGLPCAAPEPPIRNLAAAGRAAIADDDKKRDTQSKVSAWHQQLAEAGDPYGQLQLGLRYLKAGDTNAAIPWLRKAAAQTNLEATLTLSNLTAAPAQKQTHSDHPAVKTP